MSTQFGEKLRVDKKLAAFNAIRGIGRGGCYRGEGWQKVRMSARVPDAAATMWTSSLSKGEWAAGVRVIVTLEPGP